ncbi:hypothetical protein [Rubritalea tangerina]|uniref:hypothetical protein n=1 Tax=Rubritalea tangerina TaxID=430798 RepID=UPI003615864F
MSNNPQQSSTLMVQTISHTLMPLSFPIPPHSIHTHHEPNSKVLTRTRHPLRHRSRCR